MTAPTHEALRLPLELLVIAVIGLSAGTLVSWLIIAWSA